MSFFSFVQVGFLNSAFRRYCSNIICAAYLHSAAKMGHSLGTRSWIIFTAFDISNWLVPAPVTL